MILVGTPEAEAAKKASLDLECCGSDADSATVLYRGDEEEARASHGHYGSDHSQDLQRRLSAAHGALYLSSISCTFA